MNFKISYKTWLKMARVNIIRRNKESGSVTDNSTMFQDEKPKTHQVEIEIERSYEITSEEDS